MRLARGRVGLIVIAVSAAFLVLFAAVDPASRPLPPRSAASRPTLLLLTSLPLVFGEGFSPEDSGSPALKALQERYRVVSISVTDPAELAKGRLLVMAQPLAQPAEDLVALDAWVRRGGRLMLFVDPMLEWPSRLPLGDPLRPPTMFMDTGLLAHWGLRLDDPDDRGPATRTIGGFRVLTVSPGALAGGCAISPDRLVAHCSIGRGRATIVADADLLDADRLGWGAGHNLDGVVKELAELEP
jgi:hypothetical protein